MVSTLEVEEIVPRQQESDRKAGSVSSLVRSVTHYSAKKRANEKPKDFAGTITASARILAEGTSGSRERRSDFHMYSAVSEKLDSGSTRTTVTQASEVFRHPSVSLL